MILNAQFPVFRVRGLFWMFLLFLDSASCRKWEFERALTPKHTNQILLLIKEWIWLFYQPAIPLVAFSGQKLAEVVQNQYWPAAKLFIFSFLCYKIIATWSLRLSHLKVNLRIFQLKNFCTFPLGGDRCGKIPVGVDVEKISSGFSMNINEFLSQLATSHLCENVCLLNKFNTFFLWLPFESVEEILLCFRSINISLKPREQLWIIVLWTAQYFDRGDFGFGRSFISFRSCSKNDLQLDLMVDLIKSGHTSSGR